MSDWIAVVQPIVLTSAVFAAFTTSAANVVISIMNNKRLKGIEKQKELNEIDKYRYSRLYELILNWHNYDTKINEKKAERIAFYRMLNLFFDDYKYKSILFYYILMFDQYIYFIKFC